MALSCHRFGCKRWRSSSVAISRRRRFNSLTAIKLRLRDCFSTRELEWRAAEAAKLLAQAFGRKRLLSAFASGMEDSTLATFRIHRAQ